MPLQREQETLLSEPFPPELMESRRSGGGQVEYLEASDAIAQANRILGFGAWGISLLQAPEWHPVGEAGEGFYGAAIVLAVRGCERTADAGTCGIARGYDKEKKTYREVTLEQHEMAYKGSVSDALKRALRQFGDQFGNRLNDRNPVTIPWTPDKLMAIIGYANDLLRGDPDAKATMVSRRTTPNEMDLATLQKTISWLETRTQGREMAARQANGGNDGT